MKTKGSVDEADNKSLDIFQKGCERLSMSSIDVCHGQIQSYGCLEILERIL